jgi:PAS domain S-box-containing protein
MSSRYHDLLLRQLTRLGIDSEAPLPLAEQWRAFLERVSRAYTEADESRYLLERSQQISSREMQQLYQRLEESQRIAGLGNWSWDRAENRNLWSEECSRIFGFDPSAPAPSYWQILRRVHAADRPAVQAAVRAALGDNEQFEIEFRVHLPNGGTRWVCTLGNPIHDAHGETLRLHGTFVDVTRRKRTELAQHIEHTITRLLAESDSAFAAIPRILQTIGEALGWACGAFWWLDAQAQVFRRQAIWDACAGDFYRHSSDIADANACAGLIARTAQSGAPVWIDDVTRDEKFSKRREAALASGLHAAFSFPIQHASGDVVGVMEFFNAEPQAVDEDLLRSAQAIGRQVAQFFQRKQAEAALRESEAHFRALVEQASDSFYVHDIDGRIIDVNQRGFESLGYTRAELLRLSISDIDPALDATQLEVVRTQLAAGGPVARESHYRRKDGTTFPVEVRVGPIEFNGQQHLLCLARDVTERQELQ